VRRDPEKVAALRRAAQELAIDLMCTCGRGPVHDDGTCPACEKDAAAAADGHLLPEWRDYIARFPTVADALAAARSGQDTSVQMGDQLRSRMQVIADSDGQGGVVETVHYLDYLDVLDTALLNAALDGDPNAAALTAATVRWVTGALKEPAGWLPAARADQEVTAEEVESLAATEVVTISAPPRDGGRAPVVGVREVTRVSGSETWDECDPEAYWAVLVFNDAIQFKHAPTSFAQALIGAGARLVVCSRCGEYLSNGFREWPDRWCSLDDQGPLCQHPSPSHRPVPHVPEEVRPTGAAPEIGE
jgi:hypothetical protein